MSSRGNADGEDRDGAGELPENSQGPCEMLQPGGNETDPEVTSCHSDDGLRRRRLNDFKWAEAIVLAQCDDIVIEPWADLAREKYESLSREVAKGQLGDMCEWVVLEHDDVEVVCP